MMEEAILKRISTTLSPPGVWCLNEVMVTLLHSNGRYNAEEIGKLKNAVYTLLGFSGWSLHEDTNGYEVVHLLFSGRSSSEEIGELSTAFCELLGFAGWSPQEDTNGYEAVHLLGNGRYKAEEIGELNASFYTCSNFFLCQSLCLLILYDTTVIACVSEFVLLILYGTTVIADM